MSARSRSAWSRNVQPERASRRGVECRVDGTARPRGHQRRGPLLEPSDDVVDGVADGLQVAEVLVVDAEADGALAELLLERLDQLDERERVGVEVVGERRTSSVMRVLVDLEDLREVLADHARTPRRVRAGSRSTWVSAGIGDRLLACRSTTSRLDALDRDGASRSTIARALDDPWEITHTPSTPSSTRATRRCRGRASRPPRAAAAPRPRRPRCASGVDVEHAEHEARRVPRSAPSTRLERDVAGEAVGDDHVDGARCMKSRPSTLPTNPGIACEQRRTPACAARRPCPAPRRSRAARRVGSSTPSRSCGVLAAHHARTARATRACSRRSRRRRRGAAGGRPGTGIGTAIAGRADALDAAHAQQRARPSSRRCCRRSTIASALPSRTSSAHAHDRGVLLACAPRRRARRPSR